MTTIDDITEATRAWCLAHERPPDFATRIVEGEYADGTRVVVGFTPNMFASQPPSEGFFYRLRRNNWEAQACFTREFVLDAGLTVVHRHAARELESAG